LRSIYGPIKENGEWRTKDNYELYALYEYTDIVTFIKVGRLKWACHVIRTDQQRLVKRILNAKPDGRRERERPKLRWEDGVTMMLKLWEKETGKM
jgi:hypothetical protein